MRYYHEIFMEASCGQDLGSVQKWLHRDGLWHMCADLTSLMF